MKSDKFILGLDIGSNSTGWALVDAKNQKIISGVRIFEAGTSEEKGTIESGRDESRAVKRREARLSRRQTWRRGARLKKLFKILQSAGFLPQGEREDVITELDKHLYETHKKDLANAHVLPYYLRARALDKRLELYELGRVIHHLGQRRGYWSNRKAGKKEKEGEVKKGILELHEKMKQVKARTLGEYYSKIDPEEKRIRGLWTCRDTMYKPEFEAIWKSQAKHYPELLTDNMKDKIYDAIFYQRPLKSQAHLIGKCELEPGRKRAPWAILPAQRYRLLQAVNNLRVITSMWEERKLTPEERTVLVNELELKGDLKFTEIRKLPKLKKSKFNLERGGEKKIPGNRTAAKLAGVFGKERWSGLSDNTRYNIINTLISAREDDKVEQLARYAWRLEENSAEELTELELEEGYCRFSRQALARLLPHMENGLNPEEAIREEYPKSRAPQEPEDFLPPLLETIELRNPAVTRALTELRRTVNTIIKKYGKPESIRIELARDIKRNRKERQKMGKNNREREKERKKAVSDILQQLNIKEPKRSDIEKVLLADECGWHCPYCNATLGGMAGLFSGSVHIEHIIPRHRSLDNSFINKTLSCAKCNHRKGDKTPFEAFGGTPEWEDILQRVKKFKSGIVRLKLERFMMEGEKLENLLSDFSSRQLNDTRYASREAADYLGLLYGGQIDANNKRRVQVSAGKVTSDVRNALQLNSILGDGGKKTRNDHRHHAVDAIAIALTDATTVKRLADAYKQSNEMRKEERREFWREKFASEVAWDNFLRDVRESINDIVVSHRVSREVTGALHEETNYSPPRDENGRRCEDGKFVHVRKPLEAITKSMTKNIVDGKVKEIVERHLEAHNGDMKKAFSEPNNHPYLQTKDGRKIPIHKVRIKVPSGAMQKVGSGKRERWITPGSNHHIEIWREKDKKGREKWDGDVVTMLEAVRRKKAKPKEPIIRRNHGEGKEFVFSLAGGEIIEIIKGDDDIKPGLYRVRILSTVRVNNIDYPRVSFVHNNDARKTGEMKLYNKLLNPLRKLECQKVTITPLGEVRRAND